MKKFLGIICFVYCGLISYLWLFDKIKLFLAPQMIIYLKLSLIPLFLMGLVLLFNDKLHYHFKISDLVLLLPVVMLFLVGDGKLSLSFASSRIDTSSIIQKNKAGSNTNKEQVIDNNKESNKEQKENNNTQKEIKKDPIDEIYFDINDQNYNSLVSYLTYTKAAHKYENKTIRVRGFSLTKLYLPGNYFMIGKYFISCCIADSSYNGYIAKYDLGEVKDNTWYEIEGRLKIGKDSEGYDFMYIDVVNIKEIDSKDEEEYVYPCYVYDNGACAEVNKYKLEY